MIPVVLSHYILEKYVTQRQELQQIQFVPDGICLGFLYQMIGVSSNSQKSQLVFFKYCFSLIFYVIFILDSDL